MLRNALLLARLFASNEWDGVGRVDVVIGVLRSGKYDCAALRQSCREVGPGVSFRTYEWTRVDAGWARLVFPPGSVRDDARDVLVPNDGGREFRDADAWLFFSPHMLGEVAFLRPTAVFCADLIPRRIGVSVAGADPWGDREALAETMRGWRRATCAFATTPMTLLDLVSYAGISPDRAFLVPLQAEVFAGQPSRTQPVVPASPGIFWVTNASPHKNHLNAIAALRAYVAAGGNLRITVCGVDASQLDPSRGATHPAARAFAAAPEVLERTRFFEEPPDASFRIMLAAHGLVWHNVLVDNGTYVAFDAARAGAHFVSSDYPSQRYLCERHGVDALWHPARDADRAAAALIEAERRLLANIVPAHNLRETSENDLITAYGAILARLAAHV